MQDFLQGTGALIMWLIFHLIIAYPLYVIAQKTNQEMPWLAFIPIANFILMLQIAQKPLWWIILMFIPCVNIIVLVVVWMAIAETMNKPSWYGFLMLIPVVNMIVPWMIAF